MVCPSEVAKTYYADADIESVDTEDTWQWWNRFRLSSDYHNKTKVIGIGYRRLLVQISYSPITIRTVDSVFFFM